MEKVLENSRKLPTSVIVRLMCSYFVIYGFLSVYYLLARFLEIRGVPSQMTGVVVSAFFAACTLARPFGGAVTERMGVRHTMIGASLLCIAGGSFFLFAEPRFFLLTLSRILMGVGASLFLVALTTYQTFVIPEEVRGRFFALVSLGSVAPLFTTVPLCEFLLARGMFGAYLGLAPFMGVLCFALSFSLPPLDEFGVEYHRTQMWGTYKELFHTRGCRILFCSALLFAMADSSVLYLSNLLHSVGLEVSPFLGATALGSITVRLFGQRVLQHYSRGMMMPPATACMGLALLAAPHLSGPLSVGICGLLFGVGMGIGFPTIFALVADLVPGKLRPKGTSMVYFSLDISWVLLPLFMGFLSPVVGQANAFHTLALTILMGCFAASLFWTLIDLEPESLRARAAKHIRN
ncbi:MAG TPA: MFS transporter [Synergistaceae bacterium]|nr:MFS transporter [Synergistaceae bacterium]